MHAPCPQHRRLGIAGHLRRTVLLAAAPPDAAVARGLHIARHLGQLVRHAHLRVLREERQRGRRGRTGRADALLDAAETVLPTRPSGEREAAGARKRLGLADVRTVAGVVEPLAGVGARLGVAGQIADVHQRAGVHGRVGRAVLVGAQLELAVVEVHVVVVRVVDPVGAGAEGLAVGAGEEVAFA